MVLDVNFMTLNILKLEFHYILEGIVTKLCRKPPIFKILMMYFEKKIDIYLFNISYLHTACNVL